MLTAKEIVEDMCEGRYADQYRNATSKAKFPSQLWLVDFVLQQNVCPLGHKTQRRDFFLTTLYAFHNGYWCSIPEIIWRHPHKSGKGCTIELLRAPEPRDYLSHFSSPTCSGRKALKAPRQMGPSLITHSLAGSSGIRVIPTCHRIVKPGELA
jgi:hypothetical protein